MLPCKAEYYQFHGSNTSKLHPMSVFTGLRISTGSHHSTSFIVSAFGAKTSFVEWTSCCERIQFVSTEFCPCLLVLSSPIRRPSGSEFESRVSIPQNCSFIASPGLSKISSQTCQLHLLLMYLRLSLILQRRGIALYISNQDT